MTAIYYTFRSRIGAVGANGLPNNNSAAETGGNLQVAADRLEQMLAESRAQTTILAQMAGVSDSDVESLRAEAPR